MFPGYHNGGMELQDDELLDLYKFCAPTSWQKQFLVQNWDPIQHSKQEFHEFCKRHEIAESITNSLNNYQVKNNNNGPRRGKPGLMLDEWPQCGLENIGIIHTWMKLNAHYCMAWLLQAL
jgi:hypothetical protein